MRLEDSDGGVNAAVQEKHWKRHHIFDATPTEARGPVKQDVNNPAFIIFGICQWKGAADQVRLLKNM